MSKSIPEQIQDLRNAIAAQEVLRPTLGDAIVDATIVVLNQKLTALESELGKSEEQRKLVTILFSDIKGSTAMAEKMDPEEWSDIMKQAFQFLIDPIYRHQGLVARLMGDAILAFFGAETVREDDAERAVRAGLEILTGMKPFQEAIAQQHGAEFGVRVGINTGLALLSNVGTDQAGEFTALGDAVNLAARMEQSAPPNHLLIAPDTYALVRERFEIEAQAPIMVKGKSEPIPVYVVVRELPKSTVEVRRGMAGLDVPMVGREAEMERLRAGYQQAREGKANCILVTGEAGSGKSRLRYEFRRWVERRGEAIQMMQGRADAATWHAPYSLLHDLFGNACGIQESDPAAEVRCKLETGLSPYLEAERADLVGQLIGFNLADSPAVRAFGQSTAWAPLAEVYLAQYFRQASRVRPMLLLLEDLHWADQASLDFLLGLPKQMPTGALMLLGLGRTELLERLSEDCCEKISLGQLDSTDSQHLLETLIPKADRLPDAFKAMVIGHANGNPYYLQEIVQMLLDEGLLSLEGGAVMSGQADWDNLHLPPTLQGVLQARLDSLSAVEKQFLQRAAVLGEQFWDEALTQLHTEQDAIADIEQPIHNLEKRQLIYPVEVSAFDGLAEYIFKHALLRQAAYDTLLLKLRRVYHRQAAQWLLERCGDRMPEYLGKIGDHFERAGENEQAALFYQQQARDAYARSAFQDALPTLERAIRLTRPENEPQLAQLHLQMSNNLEKLGEYDAAIEHLNTCLGLARATSSTGVEAEALCIMAWIMGIRGRDAEVEPYSRKALELAEQAGDMRIMVRALTQVAGLYEASEPTKALEIYEQALVIARESQNAAQIATTLLNIGNTELNLRHLEAAETYYLESQAIYEKSGNRWGLENCINNLAIIYKLRHAFEKGRENSQRALQIAEEIGDQEGQALCQISLAHCAGGLQRIKEAQDHLRAAVEIIQKIGLDLNLDLLNIIGRILVAQGRYQEAAEYAGLVLTEPDLIFEISQDVHDLLDEIKMHLPGTTIEAAKLRGKTLDHENAIRRFLEESRQTE